jgi:hypothetical protein
LEDEILEVETSRARASYQDEADRAGTVDANRQSMQSHLLAEVLQPRRRMQEADLGWIREQFPNLKKLSDEFIRSTPISDLMKMESTQLKMSQIKNSRNAQEKLSINKMQMERSFTTLESGRDNRSSSLHPGRFLAGMGVSVQKQWLSARQVVGLQGYPPIGNYDMGSLGCPGMVTAKGWVEIHDPSSTEISIKQFNINNCATSDKAEDLEISGIVEFRRAVYALRTAGRLAVPWNLSFEAIGGFFTQNNFCMEETGQLEKRAQVLTHFTDYVLHQNAERWRDSEPFLTVGDLRIAWGSWYTDRAGKKKIVPEKRAMDKKQFQARPPEARDPAYVALNICNNYNMNRCKNANGKCTSPVGTALKHICNYVQDRNKPADVCGKDHRRVQNH